MSIIDRWIGIVEQLAIRGMRIATYDERGWYVVVRGSDGEPTQVWAPDAA